MRLYVEDPVTKNRIYLKRRARNRRGLVQVIGSKNFKVYDRVYSVSNVKAEPRDATAAAMALGGVIGVLGGPAGVAVGTAIGGLLGKSSDDEDKKIASEFNGSNL